MCALLIPATYKKRVEKEEDKNYKRFTSNEFFDVDLSGPTDGLNIEEFVSMDDLYSLIKVNIDSVLNSNDSIKLAKDNEIVNLINNLVGNKRISIADADDLYKFGNAQSINLDRQGSTNTFVFEKTIKKVLSLNYVLLDDIDYSTKRAQKFVPIGTNIYVEQGVVGENDIEVYLEFTGSFDGNGFEIRNLYLAEASYLSTTYSDIDQSTAITVATIKHYAMFSVVGESAVIKNFILRNPSYELIVMDDSVGIFNFANLVGINKGLIYNIGIIDKKINQQNQDISGISFSVFNPTTLLASAGGFVHTNYGQIKNSYLISKNIIVPSSLFRFDEVAPFVHSNVGSISGVAFETGTNVKPANFNPGNVNSYSENSFKTGNNLNINDSTIADDRSWNFYVQDGYPSLISLNYENGEYEINSDLDFIAFSKLINLQTIVNGKRFDEHTFVLKKDINMRNFKGYVTPSREFKGILKGGDVDFALGGSQNQNKYIYNLEITNPYIVGNKFYLGLFSSLNGSVKNINFYNNEVRIKSSSKDYGKTFYVGLIAGELNNVNNKGHLKNIITNSKIDLGTEPIGITYAGGLVGLASGKLEFVANTGLVNGNIHDFNNRSINARYYIGGLVGTNSGNIEITYSLNEGNVTGIGSNNSNYNVTDSVNTYTGGIIGELNNFNKNTSKLVYLSNYGEINANKFVGKPSKAYQHVGGIFGNVRGYGFTLNDGSNVRNGRFENVGLIKGEYVNANTFLYAAGIGVLSTTETLAKVSYMSNHKGYEITNLNYQNHNKNIYYAATVIDNSSGGIELSRAYNYQDYKFSGTYFQNISGLANPAEINIAPFFTSLDRASSKLLYVENKGNLEVGSVSSDTIVVSKLKVANITQATRVDYQNVVNSGNIDVLRINNTNSSIYVAGVTWILAYASRPYTMNNVINEGRIVTAGIKGNTTVVGTVTGTRFSDSTFSSDLSVKNLYVAGVVNINVGEIKNVFNLGNITSKYNLSLKDIHGTANSFVGGIVTFNYNLVQDAANSGLIEYTNGNTNSQSYFAATTNISTTNLSIFGGISIAYTGGIVIGGIVSAFGDVSGTELIGHAQGFINNKAPVAKVIDITNNGDIYGKAKEYVRSGGVLGIALSVELASGTYSNNSNIRNITAGPFTTAIIGSEDPVSKSLLSNGLNYGNVYAVTQTIGSYGDIWGEGKAANSANALRPGINSSAGGVISYGLTEMIRMLNHGVVSSTDVAGGIVGATYILGGSSLDQTPITTININTAVHYGKIKAIKRTYFNNFNYDENENFNNSEKYYPDGDTIFIFHGTSGFDKAAYQNGRRGFGGIFGRLQRGNYGTMESTEFKNIMNMDPYIDMVGRVDSSEPGSLVYYRFFTGEDTYYSAKPNDTTPNALVGWHVEKKERFELTNAKVQFTVKRRGTGSNPTYYVTYINVLSENNVIESSDYTKVVMKPNDNRVSRHYYNLTNFVKGPIYSGDNYSSSQYNVSKFNINPGYYNSITNGQSITFEIENYSGIINFNYSDGTWSGLTPLPPTIENLKYPIRKVTDNRDDYNDLYIFDENFPLMEEANSEYIYAVNANALASRFQEGGSNPKPNGMYVLASSTGSLDGATLPTNIKVGNLLKLKEEELSYIDFDNVPVDKKILDSPAAEKLINNYESMYQLSFNNKAEILPENRDETPLIADLKLYDPNGNSPILTGGVVDYTNKTITYSLSNSAFSQNNFYYEILENTLSSGAIIAKDGITNNQLLDFRSDYENRTNDILPTNSNYKATFSGTLSSGNQVSLPIKVYSQISIMDQNIFYLGEYIETYTLIIKRESTAIQTNASIRIDNTGPYNVNSIVDNYTINQNTLLPDGKLEILFTGRTNAINNLIPLNHLMTIHKIELIDGSNVIEIDEEFYTYEIIPKTSNNSFGFIINFSDQLKSGNYKITYSYYSNSNKRSVTITKRASTSFDVVDINYNHFSNDLSGDVLSFTRRSDLEFTTFIEFGYLINGVTKSNKSLGINLIDISEYSYIDIKYYELSLDGQLVGIVQLAPFATLNSATIHYQYTEHGKIEYRLNYSITNENGSTRLTTHKILERNLDSLLVYLDDNLQNSNQFSITREAMLSKIDVDFNFINNSLYDNVIFNLYFNGIKYNFDEEEIFTGNHNNTFIFYITSLLDKGIGEYRFDLEREEGIYYILGLLEIEKLSGQSAYLLDIKFTIDDNETIFEYPIIRATDVNGVINNNYDPRIYSDGIDYGNTIENNIYNFRIDGKVSDIILEHYSPRFVLPFGATIERFDYSSNTWVGDLNDDFTSSEDDGLRIVKYRVISEDRNETVNYFITAKDFRYNLTLRFKIYYELPNGSLIEANNINSPIKNKAILIASKNLELDNIYLTTGPTVNDFPKNITADNILGINNQTNLYYFTNPNPNINYRYGRNMTGAYNFNIVTPIYSGTKTENLTPGERYHYEMYIMPPNLGNWKTNNYKLPLMKDVAEGYSGLYYFVSSTSPNPITRDLAIVIKAETRDKKWGLYDDYASWD